MSVTAAGKSGSDLEGALKRVRLGQRVVLRKGKKSIAAVVSMADLRRLERLEDRDDVAESLRRLADPGEKRSSYTSVRRRAGL